MLNFLFVIFIDKLKMSCNIILLYRAQKIMHKTVKTIAEYTALPKCYLPLLTLNVM